LSGLPPRGDFRPFGWTGTTEGTGEAADFDAAGAADFAFAAVFADEAGVRVTRADAADGRLEDDAWEPADFPSGITDALTEATAEAAAVVALAAADFAAWATD
jgi:hypothetical protein